MGKSGHIGGKIAATLAQHRHPGVSSYIRARRVTADIGNDYARRRGAGAVKLRGKTDEILTIAPVIKRLGVSADRIYGQLIVGPWRGSPLCTWTIGVPAEACPAESRAHCQHDGGRSPWAMQLAVALLKARGVHRGGFCPLPSGPAVWAAGSCCTSGTFMRAGKDVPKVAADTSLAEGLMESDSQKASG